jgi:hypothetical protein
MLIVSYDHSIERFKNAKRGLETAEEKRQLLADQLQRAVDAVSHPLEAAIAEAGRPVTARYVIEASKWPTPQQMQEILADYARARDELRAAYYALSNDDKKLVGNPGL